jgi:hypothetical protein
MPNPIKDPGSMPSTGHPPGSDAGSNIVQTTAPSRSDSGNDASRHLGLAHSAASLHQFTMLIAALSAENRELRESAMKFGDLAERLAMELRHEKANRRRLDEASHLGQSGDVLLAGASMQLSARDERETTNANTESTPGGARLENR